MDRSDVVIIMDAGLAGAIACAMECERGASVVAWHTPPGGALSAEALRGVDHERAAALVREQAELYGAVEIVLCEDWSGQGGDASSMLLEAARGAMGRGASRVIWPRACGEDLDEMFRVSERADLAARLAMLDGHRHPSSGTPALRIETPFVDLTPEQLKILASDLEIDESIWAGGFRIGAKVA
jgi:hypothetical protein